MESIGVNTAGVVGGLVVGRSLVVTVYEMRNSCHRCAPCDADCLI